MERVGSRFSLKFASGYLRQEISAERFQLIDFRGESGVEMFVEMFVEICVERFPSRDLRREICVERVSSKDMCRESCVDISIEICVEIFVSRDIRRDISVYFRGESGVEFFV